MRNRGRREDLFADFVTGEFLIVRLRRIEHQRAARFVGEEDFAIGRDRRRRELIAEAFSPERLAGVSIQTRADALVVGDVVSIADANR